MILDTLKLKTKLERAGLDNQAAIAIADALGNADFDQLATKADLKTATAALQAQIDTVKTALQAQIDTVKADLQAQIAHVRTDFQTEITTVKTDIAALTVNLQTQIASVKTDLYRVLWIQWASIIATVAAIATISKLF